MTETSDNEINILLPMIFVGILVIFFFAAGFLFWILRKTGVVKFISNQYIFSLLKDIFLGFAGVAVFGIILKGALFIIHLIGILISK
jgi:hypothetical protein